MPPAASLTTPIFLWTSSVCQSGTATHCRPPLGQGYGSPGHYRGRTRLHHPGRRARSAPSDVCQIGPVTLRDILSSLRALAGGRYPAPRLTSLTFPIAPSPTLLRRTTTWHLTTEPGAGGAPGHLRHPRPATIGRPTDARTPAGSDVAGAAHRLWARGRTPPHGLPTGRVWRRNRRTQSGGQS